MNPISVTFQPSGRGKAQCDPDPDFPEGKHVILSAAGVPTCEVDLPYPAPECGLLIVKCALCNLQVALTAAGRPDDPRSVRVPCLISQPKGEPS